MIFSLKSIYGVVHSVSNKCSGRLRTLRLFAFFAALAVSSTMISGCAAASDNPFPKVTQPENQEVTTSTSSETDPVAATSASYPDGTVLKIAAPISNSTARYLAKLYEAKKSGAWISTDSGASVTLAALDRIDPDFNVEVLQTPSTGATEDTIAQWEESGFVPDIIYTEALSSLYEKGDILSLSDYAASNPLFLPTRIYKPMLNACSAGDELYGVPYAASAQILYVNMNVLSEAGVDSVPFDLDLDTLKSMSEAVRSLSTEETPLEEKSFAFYKASDLLAFLPSAYDAAAGWFMYNGSSFDFGSVSFADAVSYLRSYVQAGYSVDSLTAEEHAAAFSTLDPRLSKRVAMWVGSTAEVSLWSVNRAYKLSISQIPSSGSETESKLALTVYPLCISSSSLTPQLACDFAAFMALDEDAILLTNRLENIEGILPVVSSTPVWEAVCLQQTFGEELLLLQDKVPTAYYNPITNHIKDSQFIEQLLTDYSALLLDDTVDLQTVISSLSNERNNT